MMRRAATRPVGEATPDSPAHCCWTSLASSSSAPTPAERSPLSPASPPGHELLRDVYATIASSVKRRDAKGWVERFPRELGPLRKRVARGLVQRGILSEEHSKMLGVLLTTTRFPTLDPAPERGLRERLQGVLLADREPTEEEALLVGLLEPLGLIDAIVPKDRRKDARRRAKAVAEQRLTGTAVRDAIRAVQAAVIAAIAASTVVSAN